MCWGIFNTFTEHDFLHKRGVWSHKDMQHTSVSGLAQFLSQGEKSQLIQWCISSA